jgi:hypothetical protein
MEKGNVQSWKGTEVGWGRWKEETLRGAPRRREKSQEGGGRKKRFDREGERERRRKGVGNKKVRNGKKFSERGCHKEGKKTRKRKRKR